MITQKQHHRLIPVIHFSSIIFVS